MGVGGGLLNSFSAAGGFADVGCVLWGGGQLSPQVNVGVGGGDWGGFGLSGSQEHRP